MVGKRLVLKHHPFPFRDKAKKEYVIGEALLKWKGIAEKELATLRNVKPDPPDLVFGTKESGQTNIEITEFVPYDRNSEAQSSSFLQRLQAHLRVLGTRPTKPSNIFVSREPFDFPSIGRVEIESIARQVDEFFNTKDFEARYETIQEIVSSPLRITFIPARGTWAHLESAYENNLLLQDITGYPKDRGEIESSFEHLIENKSVRAKNADILVIFQTIIGIMFLDDSLLNQIISRLTSALTYHGIYIVELIPSTSDYWVHVITVRGYPLLESRLG